MYIIYSSKIRLIKLNMHFTSQNILQEVTNTYFPGTYYHIIEGYEF